MIIIIPMMHKCMRTTGGWFASRTEHYMIGGGNACFTLDCMLIARMGTLRW